MRKLLLHTDQICCYAEDGTIIPCDGAGQDASFSKPVCLDASRFQIADECVLDTVTGVLWSRNANPADFPLSFDEARAFVADMAERKAHGRNGWRLPPRWALFSLISHQHVNPVLAQGHPFRNVVTGYYWASDPCSRFPDQGWHVHLGGGRVPRAKKQEGSLVWPVCLPDARQDYPAQSAPERFQEARGGIFDARTALVWSKDAAPAKKTLSWQQALDFLSDCNRQSWQGCADWRMPNIRELESLADLAADSPALMPGHPFTGVSEVYWSSTTSLYEPRYAWALYFRDGIVGVGFKPDTGFSLWPVRGGGRRVSP